MANLGKTYDDSAPLMGGGGFPLNEGEHPFIIISEEICESKANIANKYLKYNCVVDDGEQKGTDFIIILNFWNSNPTAVDIAGKEFNSLRIAAQVPATNESSALVNRRAIAVVKRKTKGKAAGEVSISDYAPVAGVQQAAATPATTQPAAQAAPQTTAPATTAPAASAQADAPWR